MNVKSTYCLFILEPLGDGVLGGLGEGVEGTEGMDKVGGFET